MRIQNSPVRVEMLWVLLELIAHITMNELFRLLQKLFKMIVCLGTSTTIWIGIRESSDYLIVEILINSVHVLLHVIQTCIIHLQSDELIIVLVLFFLCQGTSALHWEMEVQNVYLKHRLSNHLSIKSLVFAVYNCLILYLVLLSV